MKHFSDSNNSASSFPSCESAKMCYNRIAMQITFWLKQNVIAQNLV